MLRPADTMLCGQHNEGCGLDPAEAPPDNSPKAPVLLVLHQQRSCAGAVGYWLRCHGYHLDVRRPVLGQALPTTLAKHAGVIVFGGPQSANDDTAEIRREIDWLALPLKEQVPFLGICLGAQMMVRQLGGQVRPHPQEMVEIGYRPVEPTEAGRALIEHWPERCFQWHKEGFEIPAGAERLAGGSRFANQAFRYGQNTFGVQFHPEITELIIRRWSVHGAHMLDKKGAHKRERLLHDHHQFVAGQRSWLDQFMSLWAHESLLAER